MSSKGPHRMDPARATISTLRQRVEAYLEHLTSLLTIREQPFLPVPFPDDPTRLPPGFPYEECVVTTHIEWQDGFNTRHTYEVKLRYFNPMPDDRFLAWEIMIKPWGSMEHRVQLGLLEIERALYDHPELVHFNGPFVLDGLKRSVMLGTPIRVRGVSSISDDPTRGRGPSLEVIEMRSVFASRPRQ